MRIPEIDNDYLSDEIDSPTAALNQLCFRAQEILSAYALYDFSMTIDEDTPTEFKPTYKLFSDPVEDEDSNDDDEKDSIDDFVTHQKTAYFTVNDTTQGVVDNIPFMLDDSGNIQLLIQPGFVAIKLYDQDDYDTVVNKRRAENISANTTQVVFRLPWHDLGPAVFVGFSLTDDDEIDIDDVTEDKISTFQEDIVDLLREEFIEDARNGRDYYSEQNIPVPSIASSVLHFLYIKDKRT